MDAFTNLGVTSDPNLTFKNPGKKLCNKIKCNLANFRYIRGSLAMEASHMYLNSMILPHLSNCMSCWSHGGKITLKPLESLNESALKIHDK